MNAHQLHRKKSQVSLGILPHYVPVFEKLYIFEFHLALFIDTVKLCKTATLKKTVNWFSRLIIMQVKSIAEW